MALLRKRQAFRRSDGRRPGRRGPVALVGLLAVGLLAALPAAAQDQPDLSRGKRIWTDKGRCTYCHGWAGDGQGDPFAPIGANLRTTALNRDQIREVVQCGLPGTQMPYHDKFAYTDDRCYGVTEEDLGRSDMPPDARNALNATEIDAVTDYVMAKIVGRGDVTLEECAEFFGEDSPSCEKYAEGM